MSGPPRNTSPPTLRLTPLSVVRAVAMFGLTAAALAMVAASARVIGWILAAAVLAGLLHPMVTALGRRIPRGLALAVVVLLSLGIAVGIVYAVVDELADQLGELRDALPDAARDVERSERFGEVAREVDLAQRAQAFVDELPERLRGGEVQDAIRSAATRGVAFLATGILTIFFLIHGPRLLRSAIRQLPEDRRVDATRIGESVYRRSWHYVAGTIAMSALAGLVVYGCAVALDLPGKAPLALAMAVLNVIPLVGVLLGATPIVLLAGTTSTWPASVAVVAVLVGWQLLEALWLQRRVEERSLHIGPFVTIAVAMIGLEVYGIGGALVALVVVVVVAAALDELFGHGPRSAARTLAGDDR